MSTSVSVTYTYHPNTAAVTIVVQKNASGDIEVIPASPALLLGDWTVIWNLQAGTGVSNPKFDEKTGIAIGETPPLLSVHNSHRVSDTQWRASLTNGVQSANVADYDINGTVDGGTFFHDPTIAVTNDPPPGG